MPTVLRYPYEAITAETDYLQLTIKRYPNTGIIEGSDYGSPSNPLNVGIGFKSSEFGNPNPEELVEDGIILLPMPTNINDRNQVNYGPDSLDPISAAAAGIGVETMTEVGANLAKIGTNASGGTGEGGRYTIDDFFNKSGGAINDILSKNTGGITLDDLRTRITQSLAANAASLIPGVNVTGQQLLARQTGQILNPNMELLFNAPALRSFSFQFKMTPRDERESLQSKSIIRSLKRNMAPYTGTGRTFLETPNVFELEYRKGNSRHPFLHKFKQSALTDISVNYTGENVYATYGDGTPISMIMTLAFTELAPIYQDDYDEEVVVYNSDGEAVGYGSYGDSNSVVKKYEGVGY